ncbi:YncE family protein [Paenibacillus sp. FSL R7-0302]|uniref:YncE family protein n=1 Tax=Paenibacillus sp. FSL R7-0302 TaxID=2921681 RepID=UPI0030F55628
MTTDMTKTKTAASGSSYLYVDYVNYNVSGYLAFIDPESDEVIRTIIVGFDPGPMCIDVDERMLYVLSSLGSSVTVVDTKTMKVTTSFHVGQGNASDPVAIFASPVGGKLYIADSGEKTVVIINTLTNAIIKDVDVGPGKPFAFASNKNSNFVYVACKVADGEDYVVAISLKDDSAYAYGKEMGLTFDGTHNPLVVHPDGHTQITLGTTGMLVHTDDKIGKPVTSSLLDDTVSGVYLDNKMLLCTMDAGKKYLKRFTDLAVDKEGHITYDDFIDVPSFESQDVIRYSRMQGFICITIQPTTTPLAAVQIYTSTGINFPLARFPHVGDLAFSSDTKAYVALINSICPIDLNTARVLPEIPMSPINKDTNQVRSIVCGYRNQS